MRTLALLALTAAAIAVPTAAWAQPAPRAGHSWGQPGQRVVVRQGPAAGAHAPGMRRDYREYRRFGRGQTLPPQWSGPQFHVRQWQSYGFPQPMPGTRWVRYYDDAILVDGRGRIHDSRESFDWDRYGHRWSRDERGVPVYVGDGDYRPDRRDYAWAEEADDARHGGGWDYSEYGDFEEHRGGCGDRGRGPCGPRGPSRGHGGGGYGHGGGYATESGYGYGYGGATITITETTVETGGGGSYVVEEVIEEVVETRARARTRRAAPRRPAPVRRPIRGERG